MAARTLAKPKKVSSGGSVPDLARFHRVALVRERQGVSLRSAARQMGIEVRELRRQEQGSTDLNLSELYRWQQVLGVPVGELLEESCLPLSRPIRERANLVRIMKTVKTLQENASDNGEEENTAVSRLAETLIGQLLELMPELAEIASWHSVGQRRSLDEYGQAAQRMISEEMFQRSDWAH